MRSRSAIAGTSYDYTLTVKNNGSSDNVGGYSVSDTLPTGTTFQASGSDSDCSAVAQTVTCTNTTGLANGATETFVDHVSLAASVADATVLSNSATVSSSG